MTGAENLENYDEPSEWLWREFKILRRSPTVYQEEEFVRMLTYFRSRTNDETDARQSALEFIMIDE